jgi:hypothetical protein
MAWALSNTICARRQVTTDPLPRRTIRGRRMPSSSLIGRMSTRAAISPPDDVNHDSLGHQRLIMRTGKHCGRH